MDLGAGFDTESKILLFAILDAFTTTKSDTISGCQPHQFGTEVQSFGDILCHHLQQMMMDSLVAGDFIPE
jgi:hypothetical protein